MIPRWWTRWKWSELARCQNWCTYLQTWVAETAILDNQHETGIKRLHRKTFDVEYIAIIHQRESLSLLSSVIFKFCWSAFSGRRQSFFVSRNKTTIYLKQHTKKKDQLPKFMWFKKNTINDKLHWRSLFLSCKEALTNGTNRPSSIWVMNQQSVDLWRQPIKHLPGASLWTGTRRIPHCCERSMFNMRKLATRRLGVPMRPSAASLLEARTEA